MESNSNRRSSSSASSKGRKRVVIGAGDSTRARYSSLEKSIADKDERASSRRPSRPTPGTLRSAGGRVAGSKAEERELRMRRRRRATQGRVALVVLAVALVVAGLVALYRSSVFSVTEVAVVGNRTLTAARVRELAALPADVTLLRLDAREAEGLLEKDPWVASAEVSRDFPDTVRIRIQERTPAALAVVGKSRWLIDGSGVWLAPQSAGATSALIPIGGVDGLDPVAGRTSGSETLLNAIEIVEGLDPKFASRLKSISASSIDKTALVTRQGVEIFVGSSEDIGRKLLVAERILEEQAGKVVYINVRALDKPTWRGLDSPK